MLFMNLSNKSKKILPPKEQLLTARNETTSI